MRLRPLRYLLTLPERVVRAGAALLGGAFHETGTLVLPRLVRRSRFYEATAKNLLRISIELVGGVPAASTASEETTARQVAVRKGAGKSSSSARSPPSASRRSGSWPGLPTSCEAHAST